MARVSITISAEADSPVNPMSLTDAVVAHYLETGSGIDAEALAKRCGMSPARIRKELLQHGGAPRDCNARKESRPSYSRDYPMMQSGSHAVWVYLPSLELLRAVILEQRRAHPEQGAS